MDKGLDCRHRNGFIGRTPCPDLTRCRFRENIGLKWLFTVRGAIEPPPEAVVVGINERAAENLGLPPRPRGWPRSIHARLVDNLVKRGASVIVFDLDFQRAKSPEHDTAFATAVAESRRVVLVEKLTGKRQPIFDIKGRHTGSVWTEELIPPMLALEESARGVAPFPVPKAQGNFYHFWAFKPRRGSDHAKSRTTDSRLECLRTLVANSRAGWRHTPKRPAPSSHGPSSAGRRCRSRHLHQLSQ